MQVLPVSARPRLLTTWHRRQRHDHHPPQGMHIILLFCGMPRAMPRDAAGTAAACHGTVPFIVANINLNFHFVELFGLWNELMKSETFNFACKMLRVVRGHFVDGRPGSCPGLDTE